MNRPTQAVLQLVTLAVLGWAPGLTAQVRPEGDEWLKQPVDDRTFATFLPFFAYDAKRPLDIRVAGVEDNDGIRVERLSYETSPGIRVTARLYHAPGKQQGGPGLVFLHGGTGAGKDSPGFRQVVDHFARAGFTVLAIDLQYFGERTTELLREFTEEEKHDKLYNQPGTYLSWVTQTVKDAGRAIDVLVERGIDPERIGLVGFSRGAQLAFIVGGVDRRFAAVVAIIGGHFDFRETGHVPAACPANYIGRISPRPLLMVNGNADPDYIRATSVEPLARLAREPKQIIWLETGHLLPQGEIRTTIATWLHQRLDR